LRGGSGNDFFCGPRAEFWANRPRVFAMSCVRFCADGSESCRFRFGFDPLLIRFRATLER
jgi:hypothetical protein